MLGSVGRVGAFGSLRALRIVASKKNERVRTVANRAVRTACSRRRRAV